MESRISGTIELSPIEKLEATFCFSVTRASNNDPQVEISFNQVEIANVGSGSISGCRFNAKISIFDESYSIRHDGVMYPNPDEKYTHNEGLPLTKIMNNTGSKIDVTIDVDSSSYIPVSFSGKLDVPSYVEGGDSGGGDSGGGDTEPDVPSSPTIGSISVVPSYIDDGQTAEQLDGTTLASKFNLNVTISEQPYNIKWYVAHNYDKSALEDPSLSYRDESFVLTEVPSKRNVSVRMAGQVDFGEFFCIILEVDGIKEYISEIFIMPALPLVPTNFTCTNVKGESATINNSTSLTITDILNFSWTLDSRNNSSNGRLPYKKIIIDYSTKGKDENSVYSEWNELYSTNRLDINSARIEKNDLIKGSYYGFKIKVEDLEGTKEASSYIINTFRSIGLGIKDLDINFKPVYKPLSMTNNIDYDIRISNNKGNVTEVGNILTYEIYGKFREESKSLLFIYTCTYYDNDKGYILEGKYNKDKISFDGNNDTVEAQLSGEIIKSYINSVKVPDKNKIYNEDNDFNLYIIIRDEYGELDDFLKKFNVDYREAPTWPNGIVNFPIGINYNINNSTAYERMLTINSSNNDRMINYKEKIRFKIPVMEDLNRTENEPVDNDVNKYRLYITRLEKKPSENPNLNESTKYSQYDFSLLKEIIKSELPSPQTINGKKYYIYDYEFPRYKDYNYFLVFKLEGIDTKDQVSTPIYSNTYLVGCRTAPPNITITTLDVNDEIEEDGKTYFSKLTLSCELNDNGGSNFRNTQDTNLTYSNYPNLERIIKGNDDYRINLTLEISNSPDFLNFKSKSVDLITTDSTQADIKYKPYEKLQLSNIQFDISSLKIEKIDGMRLYIRAKLNYPLGYKNVANGIFYNISNEIDLQNISKTFVYFMKAPTVSYRKNRIGINTSIFEDNDLVAISESIGKNIIRLIGSSEKNSELYVITLNLKTREIDGVIVDGGSW